jgi:hypothetical protein
MKAEGVLSFGFWVRATAARRPSRTARMTVDRAKVRELAIASPGGTKKRLWFWGAPAMSQR